MNIRVDIDENALCGETLRAMRGHGVAVVEVAHPVCIEGNGFAVVHSDGKLPIVAELLDGAKVTVGDTDLSIGRGELQAVADSEFAFDLAVGAYAAQP